MLNYGGLESRLHAREGLVCSRVGCSSRNVVKMRLVVSQFQAWSKSRRIAAGDLAPWSSGGTKRCVGLRRMHTYTLYFVPYTLE